ncbi:MAG: glycosyltransferase family 4 protein [Blastochloris sp.]|nr:glycosyltransferase family 4 protein [Blastochloris sp.]
MKILVLNQYGAEDAAPTARLAAELSAHLRELGHEVHFLAESQVYAKRLQGWRRWWHEMGVHGQLFFRGLSLGRLDWVISLTSPVCLGWTASILAKLRGARHAHWVMDVYPELAEKLGELKAGTSGRILRHLMSWAYQQTAAVGRFWMRI